jgi:hypothetical protein
LACLRRLLQRFKCCLSRVRCGRRGATCG